jgi:hypothetical protein
LLILELPLPPVALSLSFWKLLPTLDNLDRRVPEREVVVMAMSRELKAGTMRPTSGFKDGAQAHTVARFISMAAQ